VAEVSSYGRNLNGEERGSLGREKQMSCTRVIPKLNPNPRDPDSPRPNFHCKISPALETF